MPLIVNGRLTMFGIELGEVATILTIMTIIWGILFAVLIKPALTRAAWRRDVDGKWDRQEMWNAAIAQDITEIRQLAQYTAQQLRTNGGSTALDAVHRIEVMIKSIVGEGQNSEPTLHSPERSIDNDD